MSLPDGFEILFNRGSRRIQCAVCPKCLEEATPVTVHSIDAGVCYWRCEPCKVKWHQFGKDRPHKRAAVERYWEGRL